MKILYVVTAVEYGGAPAHVVHLMRHMAGQDHTVGLISARQERLLSEAQSLGVKTFPNPFFDSHNISLLSDIGALMFVYKTMLWFKPDLVHAHSTKAGHASRLAARMLRIKPVIFTAHSWAFNNSVSPLKNIFYVNLERSMMSENIKIICVSEFDRRHALRNSTAKSEQLTVIHNGIDPAPFICAKREKIKKEFNLGNDIVITTIGRLTPPKDFITLLDAVKNLPDSFKVLLVGEGELKPDIERYIRENGLQSRVIMTGYREDIPDILAASDIFVLSSRSEGLPFTIIEAMFSKLPVVATNVGGVSELINEGKTGFLVPVADSRQLSRALRDLIAKPGTREEMGKAGFMKASQQFTIEKMLIETQKVYDEIMTRYHLN